MEARPEGLSRRDALSGLIVGLTPFLADHKADMTLGDVALREVRERFAALDLDRRRTVIRARCRVTVDLPEPGVRRAYRVDSKLAYSANWVRHWRPLTLA